MSDRLPVAPPVLRWALDRSGREMTDAEERFRSLTKWLDGKASPTINQLHEFAKFTRTPYGLLFLPMPPADQPQTAEFRRKFNVAELNPSRELLDTMVERQDWLSEFRRQEGQDPVEFVGHLKRPARPTSQTEIINSAAQLRGVLSLSEDWSLKLPRVESAFRTLRQNAEAIGVVVMVRSIVGNDSHRPLSVDEFRGFALVDHHAPLVFINGRDARVGQLFTLTHELVHIGLGTDDIASSRQTSGHRSIERFCNQVTAEVLIPESLLRAEAVSEIQTVDAIRELAKRFNVSPAAMVFRASDLGILDESVRHAATRLQPSEKRKRSSSGGPDFKVVKRSNIGEPFARAIRQAVLSEQISYRDAYRLTGTRGKTFDETFISQPTRRGVSE